MSKKKTEFCSKCGYIIPLCHCKVKTIKDYTNMPKVEIDGKEYVDREIFIGYAINLLHQERLQATTEEEKLGIDLAVNIIGNII